MSLTAPNFPERLHIINDKATGVCGVIAIHSTALGPAAGGCRFWHYSNQVDLITDALRLARGMSYKNAMAGLPFGGGKAVLQHPLGTFDRTSIFRVFAENVAELNGAYITAEDVGTTITDMEAVRHRTRFVAGLVVADGMAGGDPSPWTSLGVFEAMKASADLVLGSSLKGLTVAVQGAGNVGAGLCRLLREAGANLVIADIATDRVKALASELGAQVVSVDQILTVQCDVLAPCALGGVFNKQTIPLLKAKLICGGANNQLADPDDGKELMLRGISFAPDYVVNAGGIINAAAEYLGETTEQVRGRIRRIAERTVAVLGTAAAESTSSNLVADRMAEAVIADAYRTTAV